jgi:wobble nucleotide-excising tRNase
MLTQIKSIKGLGVFESYTAPAKHPDFKRYNVIYGENGSGKTTLSRLLASLAHGTHPEHPTLEYTVESQSGILTHKTTYPRKVRVFNSDYVEASIGRFQDPLRHILILGEENKALAEELKAEIITLEGRTVRVAAIEASLSKTETSRGRLFSQVASTIGEATMGSTLRSYRKPDAEAAFAKIAGAVALSEEQLSIYRTTLRQEQMPELQLVKFPGVSNDVIALMAATANRCRELTLQSAQAAVIERLSKNPDISVWVESGLHIHKDGQSRCEFCDQSISAERLKALANHFSAQDQQLKDLLEAAIFEIDDLRSEISIIHLPDKLALYTELRGEYESAQSACQHEAAALSKKLEGLRDELTKKMTLRTTAYEITGTCEGIGLNDAFEKINGIILTHNQKSLRFNEEKSAARAAIEAHYLLGIKPQVDDFSKRADELKQEAALLRDGGETLPDQRSMESLAASIASKRAKVSNAHAGGENLTAHLRQFLGRTDLKFESDEEGYRVLRRGKAAKRLSEGEKTAIAFLYFLVQLKDQDFDLTEGVVAIDDPISSLDASAIYQAFSFLKNETQNAKQLFLLTHNFEFLRLLINWINNSAKATATYTMIVCEETASGRVAKLAPLDRLLIEHATEYHYLFKILYTFRSDGTIAGCYHVPNVARKVLESFLDFHIPSNKSLYQKMGDVEFDSHKKTAIYKFANDLSHPTGKTFDPALVAETQKNVLYLLEMIKHVAPSHYSGLEALSQI